MIDKFAEVQDQLEELEDEISGVKTQTKRDSRAIKKEISSCDFFFMNAAALDCD